MTFQCSKQCFFESQNFLPPEMIGLVRQSLKKLAIKKHARNKKFQLQFQYVTTTRKKNLLVAYFKEADLFDVLSKTLKIKLIE